MSRRLDAGRAPVLAVARAARASMPSSMPSCPAPPCRPSARRAPAGAPIGSRPAWRKAGPPALPRRAARARAGSRRARRGSGSARRASCRRCEGRARAEPSSTCRTTSPPRTSGWRCARASGRSSTSSATPRPAWRPTRARPPTWRRWLAAAALDKPVAGGRHDDLPPALYAGDLRRACRAAARGRLFDPVRTTPIHDWAGAHGAVFEDVGLWKRARYFPRPARTCTPPSRANAGPCVRASACSMPRRSARSRWWAADAAEFLDRIYVNSFGAARARPLPLRPHAQGGRLHPRRRGGGAAGARPLPRDDHDRRRGAACCSTWRTTCRPSGRSSRSI